MLPFAPIKLLNLGGNSLLHACLQNRIWSKVLVYFLTSRVNRMRVSLSVPTTQRDKRKSSSAACTNFIHQKDASIAMKVIQRMLEIWAPVYTVHNNFLTTPAFAPSVPAIYNKVISELDHPLLIINEFFRFNLLERSEEKSTTHLLEVFSSYYITFADFLTCGCGY